MHARLIEAERLGHWELLDLASEPACWRRFAAVTVKPDSYVRLARGDFEYSYFVELDRGTEGSRTIERQMERYLDYFQTGKEQAARGVFPKVLWLAPDADRAAVISDLVDRLAGPEHELFAVAVFGGVTDAVTAKAGSTEHVFRSTM